MNSLQKEAGDGISEAQKKRHGAIASFGKLYR
jgi:hypothetical protein